MRRALRAGAGIDVVALQHDGDTSHRGVFGGCNQLAFALTTQLFVRCDDGLLAPATVLSPAVGLADLPGLERYSEVRLQHRTFVVNDRRIVPADTARSVSAGPSFIGRAVSSEGSR